MATGERIARRTGNLAGVRQRVARLLAFDAKA
jgi:hypothetical protein